MMKKNLVSLVWIGVIGLLCSACGNTENDKANEISVAAFDSTGWEEEKIGSEALSTWLMLGSGQVSTIMNGQTCLGESENSQGVMLVSPKYYSGDVVMRYKALALTDATVFVTILSATDTASGELSIPDDYDGGMGLWTGGTANYFVAFKNAPHGGTPYIARNPDFNMVVNAAEQDRMLAGIYYDVEVGRQDTTVWLSIDGRRIVAWENEDLGAGGHVAFRLRGTAGIRASALIRDLVIYSKQSG